MAGMDPIWKSRQFNAICDQNAVGWGGAVGERHDSGVEMDCVCYDGEVWWRWVGDETLLVKSEYTDIQSQIRRRSAYLVAQAPYDAKDSSH